MTEIPDLKEYNDRIDEINFNYDNKKYELVTSKGPALKDDLNALLENLNKIKVSKDDVSSMVRISSNIEDVTASIDKVDIIIRESRNELSRNKLYNDLTNDIQSKDIKKLMLANQIQIDEITSKDRTISDEVCSLKILRRWNSYTPLLNFEPTESLGGGYFFIWKGTGVVIDPGINFLQNALGQGLTIRDIDVVILTHSHVDHTSDFEGLLTLLREINELIYEVPELDPLRIKLYITIGAMNKFANLISLGYDNISEIIIINPESIYDISADLKLIPAPCSHKDLFCNHPNSCVGLKFYDKSSNRPIFALSSDTSYVENIKRSYADFQNGTVVLHIGGIKEDEYDTTLNAIEIIYESHLGLKGLYNFIFDLKPKAVIISEFGEEFEGARLALSETYNDKFPDTTIIPGDVSLDININGDDYAKLTIICEDCGKEIELNEVNLKIKDPGIRISYLCEGCNGNN